MNMLHGLKDILCPRWVEIFKLIKVNILLASRKHPNKDMYFTYSKHFSQLKDINGIMDANDCVLFQIIGLKSSFRETIKDASDEYRCCIVGSQSIEKITNESELELFGLSIGPNVKSKMFETHENFEICNLKSVDNKFTIVILDYHKSRTSLFGYEFLLSRSFLDQYRIETWRENIFVDPNIYQALTKVGPFNINNALASPFFRAIGLSSKLDNDIRRLQDNKQLLVETGGKISFKVTRSQISDTLAKLNLDKSFLETVTSIISIVKSIQSDIEMYHIRKAEGKNRIAIDTVQISNVNENGILNFWPFAWTTPRVVWGWSDSNIIINYFSYELIIGSKLASLIFPVCLL